MFQFALMEMSEKSLTSLATEPIIHHQITIVLCRMRHAEYMHAMESSHSVKGNDTLLMRVMRVVYYHSKIFKGCA